MIDYCDFDRKIIMLQNEFRLNSSDKELIGQSNLNKHFENDNMNKLYRSYSYFNKIIKDENKFKTPTSKYVFYLLKYTIQLEKISFISFCSSVSSAPEAVFSVLESLGRSSPSFSWLDTRITVGSVTVCLSSP